METFLISFMACIATFGVYIEFGEDRSQIHTLGELVVEKARVAPLAIIEHLWNPCAPTKMQFAQSIVNENLGPFSTCVAELPLCLLRIVHTIPSYAICYKT